MHPCTAVLLAACAVSVSSWTSAAFAPTAARTLRSGGSARVALAAAAADGSKVGGPGSKKKLRPKQRQRASGAGGGKSRRIKGDMLESIQNVDVDRFQPGPLSEEAGLPLVMAIVGAGDKRKAGKITALRISGLTSIAEFMVIMEGTSRPQNNAIAAAIEDDVDEMFGMKPKKEGSAEGGWIVMDYEHTIVNIMTEKSRAYYDLEGHWTGADRVDVSGALLGPPVAPSDMGLGDLADTAPDPPGMDEDDPFWS